MGSFHVRMEYVSLECQVSTLLCSAVALNPKHNCIRGACFELSILPEIWSELSKVKIVWYKNNYTRIVRIRKRRFKVFLIICNYYYRNLV